VQVIYGDGLSAAAINEHLESYHRALESELAAAGLRQGTPFFVRHSRVKVMDEIARLVDAEAALFVCGERPGLGFADSLSAYYIYRPGAGATDANREVISNINTARHRAGARRPPHRRGAGPRAARAQERDRARLNA
jgi:ethanolamine ammonia-lyase small subunit